MGAGRWAGECVGWRGHDQLSAQKQHTIILITSVGAIVEILKTVVPGQKTTDSAWPSPARRHPAQTVRGLREAAGAGSWFVGNMDAAELRYCEPDDSYCPCLIHQSLSSGGVMMHCHRCTIIITVLLVKPEHSSSNIAASGQEEQEGGACRRAKQHGLSITQLLGCTSRLSEQPSGIRRVSWLGQGGERKLRLLASEPPLRLPPMLWTTTSFHHNQLPRRLDTVYAESHVSTTENCGAHCHLGSNFCSKGYQQVRNNFPWTWSRHNFESPNFSRCKV